MRIRWLVLIDSVTIIDKGPVNLIERVKIAHSFSVCVKSVPGYHFKLAYVIVHPGGLYCPPPRIIWYASSEQEMFFNIFT